MSLICPFCKENETEAWAPCSKCLENPDVLELAKSTGEKIRRSAKAHVLSDKMAKAILDFDGCTEYQCNTTNGICGECINRFLSLATLLRQI